MKNATEKSVSIMENKKLNLKAGFFKYCTNIWYLLSVAITAVISYGYFITHTPVTVDSLSGDRYYHGALLAQGRMTASLVENITGLEKAPHWIENLIGIFLLCIAATIFCIIFDSIVQSNNILPSIVFTCIYISYPLFNEYFCFAGCTLAAGGSTLLVALSIYCVMKYQKSIKGLIPPIIMLIFAISWYESFMLIYIGAIAAVLLLSLIKSNESQKAILKKGVWAAAILIIAIIFEAIISDLIIAIFNLHTTANAETGSYWLLKGSSPMLLIKSYITYWVSKAFCYVPFTVLLIAIICAVVLMIYQTIKHKKVIIPLLYIILGLCVFAMTLYRGGGAFYRTEQGFAFFVSFIFYLLILIAIKSKKKVITGAFSILLAALIFAQSATSTYMYHTEYQRYVEEKDVCKTIYTQIDTNYDVTKPVVFIGQYSLSANIYNKIHMKKGSVSAKIYDFGSQDLNITDRYRITDTSVRSYLDWGIEAFDSAGDEIYKLFENEGYTLTHCTKAQYETAKAQNIDMPSYPNNGYIKDNGKYIIVKLGDIEKS